VEWSSGDLKKLFLCSQSSIWSLNLKLVVRRIAGMLVFLVLVSFTQTMALSISELLSIERVGGSSFY